MIDEARLKVLASLGIDPTEQKKVPSGNSENFDKSRMGNFGASEFWKLLTASMKIAANDTQRNYIFEKAFEKQTGKRAKKGFTAQATDWGNEYEGSAINEYKEITGKEVDFWGDYQKFYKHPVYDVGAFPDGKVRNERRGIEAKCPFNGGVHLQNLYCGNDLEKFKKLRTKYYIQTQVQMWCADWDFVDFFSYVADIQGIPNHYLLEIPRDESVIALIEEAAKKAQAERDEIIFALKIAM